MKKQSKSSFIRRWLKKLVPYKAFITYCIVAGVVMGLFIALVPQQSPSNFGKLGETVKTDAFSIVVESVERKPYREVFTNKVLVDKDALVVRLTVQNRSNTKQPFLPVNDVFIKDNYGSIRQLEPVYGIKSPIKAGDLMPGQSVTGDISFVLDNKNGSIRLFFDPRWESSPPAAIQL